MSFDGTGSWLVLDDAQGVLEAAVSLAQTRPAAVVVNPRQRWQQTLLGTLPPHLRPKVIVPGEPAPDRRGPTEASASAG